MRLIVRVLILTLLFSTIAFGQRSSAKPKPEDAKITKEQATATALKKVPGGTVKESELEREHGKLVWSFDIAGADKQITEVQVDAMSGEVVSVEKESAKHEAAEKHKTN